MDKKALGVFCSFSVIVLPQFQLDVTLSPTSLPPFAFLLSGPESFSWAFIAPQRTQKIMSTFTPFLLLNCTDGLSRELNVSGILVKKSLFLSSAALYKAHSMCRRRCPRVTGMGFDRHWQHVPRLFVFNETTLVVVESC